jgi:hypothetical protein
MNTIWFEEELEPSLDIEEVNGERGLRIVPQPAQQQMRGVVRVNEPLREQLGPAPLTSGSPSMLWLVRLQYEFDTQDSSRFRSAQCEAYLEPTQPGEPMPTVYDLYPQGLYEGNPRTVSLNFSPTLKIANIVEISPLGGLSTEVTVGRIQPKVVGFLGHQARFPYWKLTATAHPIEGIHTFWLILAQPMRCSGIRLYTRAYGEIQTTWGPTPIPVYPKQQAWDIRPSIEIR